MFQALGGMRVASEGLLGARGLSRLDMTWILVRAGIHAKEAISGSTKL
jgi:hypothetical protein